jgi:hypothetical protein
MAEAVIGICVLTAVLFVGTGVTAYVVFGDGQDK